MPAQTDQKKLLIWGTGGHGKVVLDVARSVDGFEQIVFADDDAVKAGTRLFGCEVIGGRETLKNLAGNWFIVAVGNNRSRAQIFDLAAESGLAAATLIHDSAMISPSAEIGSGTVVMPGAIVNADAQIGENCIVNSGAIVEHDCKISDHVHLSPRSVLGGAVKVGSFAHVGMGAVILPGAVVGDDAVIGAGAVVLKHAPARVTIAGVPAKALAPRKTR